MKYDLIALCGLIMVCIALWSLFNWEVALITLGVAVFSLGVIGAKNDPPKNIQRTTNNTK